MTASPTRLDPFAYPLLLPHLGFHGDGLYFGSGPVGTVSDAEGRFLTLCDGTRTLAEAARECTVTTDFIVRASRWMVWWPEPVASPPIRGPGRPVERLVLSPHPEDGWLGMGGTILEEADRVPTRVHDVFQVFTGSHGERFRTTRELAMACSDEAATAARLGRVDSGAFAIPEAGARRFCNLSDDATRQILELRITALLDQLRPREVFIPAALGADADALLVFETVLGLLAGDALDAQLHLYADAPATLGHRQIDELLVRFESSFLAPSEYYRDVSATADLKESLLDVFACRVDDRRRQLCRSGGRRDARDAGAAEWTTAERFWNVGFAPLE